MDTHNWTPVGEEVLFSVVKGRGLTAAVVICDGEGNSKAITGWVPSPRADNIARSLASKRPLGFDGKVRLPI